MKRNTITTRKIVAGFIVTVLVAFWAGLAIWVGVGAP